MMSQITPERLKLFFKGMAMGAADVIPGVSGGTVALVTGIYQTLIESLTAFDLTKLKALFGLAKSSTRGASIAEIKSLNWGFFIPLGMGIVFSILVLSKGMVAVMDAYPAPTYAFFFGLILFSIKFPYQEMSKTLLNHAVMLIFAVLAFGFFSLKSDMALDATQPLNVFFGGAVAVCALILPGISGSTFLVIMGLYRPILAAVHDRDLFVVVTFMSGMVVGILTFIRVLNWCLREHRSITMAALAGLMLGSLKKVWPYEAVETVSESQWILIGFAVFGVALVFGLDKVAGSLKSPQKLSNNNT